MTALTWSEALALQQPRMDDTHREFVDCLNALQAARPGGGLEAAQAAVDALLAHTEAHFAQEDDWMARLGFEPDSCHPLQHRQVLEVVREVQRRLGAEGEAALDYVDNLVPALAEWFPMHARSMDAALAQVMAERGFDPDTGVLVRPPEAGAVPISGCGSGSCG
jgi:hemerythrin